MSWRVLRDRSDAPSGGARDVVRVLLAELGSPPDLRARGVWFFTEFSLPGPSGVAADRSREMAQ